MPDSTTWRDRAARLVLLLSFLVFAPAPAAADDSAEAEAAIHGFVQAVLEGDPAKLDAVLAPEFQILRSDGGGYDKAEYVAGAAANISSVAAITDVVATRHGDQLVARWTIEVNETVDGRAVESRAPRLTVFRHDNGRWLVVAHANFARIR